jgi:prepilin-type N-terminal cleavage/methylation domain-containing protein
LRCHTTAGAKGLTLIELLIAMTLLTVLLLITVSFYPMVIKIFLANKDEFDVRTEVSTARDLATTYLIKANSFTIANQGRIYFTANVDPTTSLSENCTFYFYNSSDATWPTTYPYASYELRYVDNTYPSPGIFGSGRSIVHNLNPPPVSYFSNLGNQITVNLNVTNNSKTYELRFEIWPRNL